MRPVDLGWMRVFVEVAAAGSLSAAARRLGLTQPAVSHHIRRAEAELGAALLRRVHRGTELTEAGRQLYEILARSVTQVDELAQALRRAPAQKVLRLYTDYAFSGLWLIPRIHRFRALHPEIDLQVIATQHNAMRDLRPGDTGVFFGAAQSFDGPAERLLAESVVPVCAPAFPEDRRNLSANAPLIHLDSPEMPAPWFDWPDYLRRIGLPAPDTSERRGLHFNTYSLVIEATLAGQGIALGWRGLIDGHLQRGFLVEAGPPLANSERGYFLVQRAPVDTAADHLRDFLLRESAD